MKNWDWVKATLIHISVNSVKLEPDNEKYPEFKKNVCLIDLLYNCIIMQLAKCFAFTSIYAYTVFIVHINTNIFVCCKTHTHMHTLIAGTYKIL